MHRILIAPFSLLTGLECVGYGLSCKLPCLPAQALFERQLHWLDSRQPSAFKGLDLEATPLELLLLWQSTTAYCLAQLHSFAGAGLAACLQTRFTSTTVHS